MDNNCVKYHPHLRDPWKVLVWEKIFSHVLTVTLAICPWVKVMIRLRDILSRSNLAVITYGPDTVSGMCALWPWTLRYDLGSRSWHILRSKTISVWNIIRIQLGSEELWPGHRFQVMCTVTLTSEIWQWVKVMTHHWVMDNNCLKYYPDPTWQWGVMARTRISSICALRPWPWRYDLGSRSWHTLGSWTTIVWNIIQIQHGSEELWPGHDVNRRTDGQSGRVIPIYPPKLCLRGV